MVYLFLFLVSLLAFLPHLGDPSPLFPQGDEVMHIRTIRESLQVNHWLVPELTGFPNPYKPPLLFWLGIYSDRIFSIHFFWERFVSALFGSFSTLLVYRLGFSFSNSGRMALLLAFSFLLSFGTWKFSRLVMMEEAMVFFYLAFVTLFLKFDRDKKNLYLILAYLTLGAGYLLKGPILIVYGLLTHFSFFLVDCIRLRKGKFFFEKDKLKHYFRQIPFVLFAFLIPVLWISYLNFFHEYGKALLKFFFITENLGKFGDTNQSFLRILGGWILYTLPFTIPLFSVLKKGLIEPISTMKQRVGRGLLSALFLLSILHLLPNRKDPYYILPFAGLFFTLPAIYFNYEDWLSKIGSFWNQIFLIVCYLAVALFSLYLGNYFSFLLILLFSFSISLSLYFKKNKSYVTILANLLFVPLIGFTSILPLQDPNIEQDAVFLEDTEVCVTSENPWGAMDLANRLPHHKITYSPPSAAEAVCSAQHLPILVFAEFYQPNESYREVQRWFLWKLPKEFHYEDVLDLLEHPQSLRFKKSVRYYRQEAK
ncbi:ArnT family glycosyltransferase [Leptospira idonii]|uniref:Phospholipid carrier-dependent glycosyltransferase n=1 Tax=Leptospira idonii TaxID=1193500 RepID=A0A4R9M2M5_9LEPT|nr:phospholipid carrier-dependent glycosyltransferase [Leptospira idonii]TGN20231.1 phospholipid carrier-dependent glycosyltransferase [Leptospira idonii]